MLLAVYFVYIHAVLQYLSFSVHIMCKRGWGHRSFVLLRTTWWYSAKELHVGPFRSANITDLQPESKPIIGFPAAHLSSRWRWVHKTCLERLFLSCISKRENLDGETCDISQQLHTFQILLEVATISAVPGLQQTMSLPGWILTSWPMQVFLPLASHMQNLPMAEPASWSTDCLSYTHVSDTW